MDHRGEFELLVIKTQGIGMFEVDWSSPRLVCVASDFTRYDEYAIAQINRSIELVRYRDYDGNFLTLDLVASTSASATSAGDQDSPGRTTTPASDRTVVKLHQRAPKDLRDLYDSLDAYLLSLGDDVTKTVRKNYYAFRRIKNFACVEVHPQTKKLLVYLKADPSNLVPQPGFARDVSNIGHFGTGNLEVSISNRRDLERAQPLILASYQAS
jgi:predicted transport protein